MNGPSLLKLRATDKQDLGILSAYLQDAVIAVKEMIFLTGEKRFVFVANRFRWEDKPSAEKRGRPFERVQSLLVIDMVQGVASQGIERHDKELILSLLSIDFEPAEDGAGHVLLTLAGDGSLRLTVEALEVSLRDVTRPYVAASKNPPRHGD